MPSTLLTPTYEPIVEPYPSHSETRVIENKVFYAMAPGLTAIDLTWPTAPSVAEFSVVIRNCKFLPGLYPWVRHIRLTNGWCAVIENVNGIAGQDGSLQVGIDLVGQCLDVKISKAHFTHPVTGINVGGESEGVNITQTSILGGVNGVVLNTPQGEAGAWITQSHFSVARAGIIAVNRPQAVYSNLLVYRYPWRAGELFDGVILNQGCSDTTLRDIAVKTFGAPGNAYWSHWDNTNVRVDNVQLLPGM
ncbi:MAG TPA: hypothetical protein VFN64_00565 [Burkholderiaceae bacterium]|nr:hypothetical protein [Burkholderiaceae bacterium]